MVEEANDRLKKETFDDVFQWAKQRLVEYPNCHVLILWMARVFDSQRQIMGVPDGDQYDNYILDCYKRVLESDNEGMKSAAAEALYHFYLNDEQYEQAEEYLTYFSEENPERKRKQAMIYGKTGRQEDAHKMYEELLFAGYQSLSMTFNAIYMLALKENDLNKAHILMGKIQKLAHLFEMGEYHEISLALELATLEKNEVESLHVMERMLSNLESIYGFAESPLYSHMEFKAIDEAHLDEVRKDLMKAFRDEETYAYLKESQRWRELVGGSEDA